MYYDSESFNQAIETSTLAAVILGLEAEYGIEGDSYQFTSIWQTILTKVATEDAELAAEVAEAHTEALAEDLWRCDSAGNVLPTAKIKVSLVKSAPATIVTAGHPAGMLGIHRNDLRLLHWAITGGTL
jgi:hypothetical protein